MQWCTPRFWQYRGFLAHALLPFAMLYCFVYRALRWRSVSAYQSKIPVICVGNVVIGGAGKTPTAIALALLLKHKGYKPAFISRGYGGTLAKANATLVDAATHTAQEVGDEPLLLANHAPTYIASNRVEAVKLAEKNPDINLLIMDDGLQNETVRKSLSFLVMHGKYGVGNGFLFPAGPLRESLLCALRRVDAILINGNASPQLLKQFSNKPQFGMEIKIESSLDKTLPYIAFAGIAHPQRFFDLLEKEKCKLIKKVAFADHYPYKHDDLMPLIDEANQQSAQLVTTEKDWVRLPNSLKEKVRIFVISHSFIDKKDVSNWLDDKLSKGK